MKPAIVFFSDFGLDSGLVSCMHGVCKQVDASLQLYDGTHLITPFDIRAISYTLQYTVPCWPEGTVFVSVVDPGVGTSRKACVAKLKNGSFVVTPDNGTLTLLADEIGIEEIREIDEDVNRYRGAQEVSVFHGRDLFSFCAAKLAAGVISYKEVGPAYAVCKILRHPTNKAEIRAGHAKGVIESSDPFGTVETNFSNAEFAKTGFRLGEKVRVLIYYKEEIIFDEAVLYEKTFGCVKRNELVLLNDLAGYVSLALNETNFAKTYHINKGEIYDVEVQKL